MFTGLAGNGSALIALAVAVIVGVACCGNCAVYIAVAAV